MSLGPVEKKQYRPVPEEPRFHRKKSCKHKPFLLERKLKPGGTPSIISRFWREPEGWHTHGHYARQQDAEKAKAAMATRFYYNRFEYRIVDTRQEVLDHVG